MAEYTTFRGKKCCACLAAWLPVFEKELLRRKVIKHSIDVYQLTGNAGASAGTHSKGGAFDLAQTQAESVKVARQMGADATWKRPKNWDGRGGIEHLHGVLTGCPHNSPARYQIDEVRAGRNGLANRGKDTGPRPLSGRTWKEGIAWAKAQAKPESPDPEPTGDSFGFRLSLINRNAQYWRDAGLKSYTSRVAGLAALAKTSGSSVDLGCECGTYAEGAAYDKARGWGANRVEDDRPVPGDSFVLHGGAVPVTTAIDIDADKRRFVATGQFETAGTRNRWATWGVLEDRATGIRVLVGVTHLEFEPKGPNPKNHWGNERRYDQLNATFSKLVPIAEKYKVAGTVVGGDMNGLAKDPRDGPGMAAKKHGYIEAKSGRIDRVFIKGNIEASNVTTTVAYPSTDQNHYLIGVHLDVHK